MSKGGTTSGSTEIPAWLENAAIENINKARDVSQIGYVPYYGPDVAAFSPMQQQSMQSTGNAASAFGLAPQGFNAMAGMPQAETFAGGLQGYSSAPLYEQSLDKLFANAPAQYNAMADMVIDPFTGARSRNNYGNASPVMGMARPSINGGGGIGGGNAPFVDQVHADRMAGMNNGGEHYGVNREYNPYAGVMPDGSNSYYDMSFGEDGRREIGMGESIGEFLLGGPSRAFDAVGRTLFDISGAGSPTMTQKESVERINRLNSGYNSANDVTAVQTDVNGNPLGGFQPYYQPNVGMVYVDPNLGGIQGIDGVPDDLGGIQRAQSLAAARLQADRQRALDVALAQQEQEDLIAAGLIENPISNAVTTPYVAPVVRSTVNSGGNGTGAEQRAGGSKVGGVNRGTNAFSGM